MRQIGPEAHYEDVASESPKLRLVRPGSPAPSPETTTRAPVDTTDLDAVFRRFAPYVAKIGARLLGRHDEIDDLVQDVFLDAVRGLRALREPDAVRAWLATVTVRRARRRLKRRALLAVCGLDREMDVERLVDPEASADTRAQLMALYRALDGVPVDARIAWILFHVEGYSLEELAEVGGCSRATAHRRVRRAQAAVDEVRRA